MLTLRFYEKRDLGNIEQKHCLIVGEKRNEQRSIRKGQKNTIGNWEMVSCESMVTGN
jgi:hypothetical protein